MKELEFVDIKEKDLETIRSWRNSPEVNKYMYSDGVISTENQKKWFEKIQNDPTTKHWLIKADNESIGVASLTDIDGKFSSCSWGFYLGNPEIRGKGIGKKIMAFVCHYVFEELELNKLMAQIFKFNERTIYLTEKYGFRREAYYREHSPKDGKYVDVVGIAMLKREYDQLKMVLNENKEE